MIGLDLATRIKDISIAIYKAASDIAAQKGIIIADTKFEFGLDEKGQLVLMDEILTADSSRFWPAATYLVGANPPSFDKQFLRDWLESVWVDGKPWGKTPPPPHLLPEIINKTAEKYREALHRLTQ
jgi:phosphoribosylaminoimidazole-succinocarboxamide synthase